MREATHMLPMVPQMNADWYPPAVSPPATERFLNQLYEDLANPPPLINLDLEGGTGLQEELPQNWGSYPPQEEMQLRGVASLEQLAGQDCLWAVFQATTMVEVSTVSPHPSSLDTSSMIQITVQWEIQVVGSCSAGVG